MHNASIAVFVQARIATTDAQEPNAKLAMAASAGSIENIRHRNKTKPLQCN
jgi:hypothetical protein